MEPDRDTFVVDNEGEILIYLAVGDDAGVEQMIAWWNAHGIDHRQVPVPGRAAIRGGMLTLELYALNEQGSKYLDESGEEVVRTTRTVPLVMAPPACWVSREVAQDAT